MADDYTPSVDDARIAYAGGWAPESIVGRTAYAEFDRMIAQVRAEAIRSARNEIMPPVNCELRPDGTEDPEAAEYVAVMSEAHDRLGGIADRIEKEAGL